MPSYQTIFLVISVLITIPVLVYYYRRHPHPRFRPKIGEMAVVSLIAFMCCWGGSSLIGTILDDPDQFKGDFAPPSVGRPGASSATLPDSSEENRPMRRNKEPSPEDFKK